MATNGKVKATIITKEGEGTEVKVSYTCTAEQEMFLILSMIEHLAERMGMSLVDTTLALASKLADKDNG